MANVHNKISCPTCGRALNVRQVSLYDGMAKALASVFRWCVEKNRFEHIRFKEFAHLLGPNEIQRFRDWRYFSPDMVGGQHGYFDFNADNIRKFLSGNKEVPSLITKDPLTKEVKYFDMKTIHEIYPLFVLLTEGEFNVQYGSPDGTVYKSKTIHQLHHLMRKKPDGSLCCTCPGYRYRKTCKHMVDYAQFQSRSLFN